jgi:phage-related tail protein
LLVGGTADAPEVSLTAGAKIGAALGTLLMPGVGTGAGAAVGSKVGEAFRQRADK